MPRGYRQKTVRVKIPKPLKLPRPRVKLLRQILKGLVTFSAENRIAVLCDAMLWYDQAVSYLMQKGQIKIVVTTDPKKRSAEQIALGRAKSCRDRAPSEPNIESRETSCLMAVRNFEVACAKIRPVSINKYWKLYEDKKGTLKKKQDLLVQRYGLVFQTLQKIVGDHVRLHISDALKPLQYDPDIKILNYNRNEAKRVVEKFRTEGLLPVFLEEMKTWSYHSALEKDDKGQLLYSVEKDFQITKDLLLAFLEFARGSEAPKRLVKSGVVRAVKTVVPRQVGTASVQRPRVLKGPLVGGYLTPGTAKAVIYERIRDEQVHPIVEVLEGITTGNPLDRIRSLKWTGDKKGCWTITMTADSVQLKHTQSVGGN